MNIHLISNEKFTNKFVEMIEKEFEQGTNLVYIYDDGSGFKCNDAECAICINSFSKIDLSLLGDNDKLFVHAFYDGRVLRFLYKNIHRIGRSRLVLIAWGADIYNEKLFSSYKLDIRTIIREFIKKRIVKSCNLFMTFACADMKYIKKYYGGQGIQFDCLYPSNANIEFLKELKEQNKDSSSVRILLGNSATKTNQHLEMLDTLSKYKEMNIEIICPLSYGNREYAQTVIDYGRRLYGNKFKPILDYLSADEYSTLLNSVQIAVFNHNRQQGTGNIEILGYLGKKIYIRSDTTTWEHYVTRDKCRLFDATEIQNISFENFVQFNADDKKINEEYFIKIWDIKYIKSLWDKVMEYRE